MKKIFFPTILIILAVNVWGWYNSGKCTVGMCPSGQICLFDDCISPDPCDLVGGKIKFVGLIYSNI